ncbi:MAG TPA: CBS domain-containing protein [Phototrophicaceae bacterium]|nr:CBS domain-containing protein [Phototrophicaceae bacterium]
MLENTQVQDCMTHPAITIMPNMSLRLAQQLMRDCHIRHLPVVKDKQLVGILSSGDIRRAMPSDATTLSIWEIRALWDKVTVEEAMTRYIETVKRETPILEAVRLMAEHRFNSLPVVDDLGQLVGIVTEVDIFLLLLRVAGNNAHKPAEAANKQAAIPS